MTTENDGLPPCDVCSELDREVTLPLADWWPTVELIRQRVDDGTLEEVPGAHRFAELTVDDPYMGELMVEFRFACRACDRHYLLGASTDRQGVRWGPPPGPPRHAPDAPWQITEDSPQHSEQTGPRRRWWRPSR